MQEIPGIPVHDLPESKIIQLSKEIGKISWTFYIKMELCMEI